ncbi:MAG: Hpt domain-containing protein [Chitinophagaceae bacterium]|jgi:HPt (histidine-containing phosphotransfer) domain-containing protein|nr:Hpt domain-containing protein [Chitinophagaceae bacterium]
MSTSSNGHELPDAIKLKVYPLFLQLFPESLASFEAAVAGQQWAEARQLAHKMTGTLGALGTQSEVSDRLQDVRQAIKEEQPLEQINALYELFAVAAKQALTQVASFLQQSGG